MDFEFSNGTITKYIGSDTHVVIPDMINGQRVTASGEMAFDSFNKYSSLTSVSIPSSVTTIGDHAFSHCKNLTSVNIPSSVITIDNSAFCYCTSLTSVNIPFGVTTIEMKAFAFCDNLMSVSIPPSVTTIGKDAFALCHSLDYASKEAIRRINPEAL
jgi:hypothetical protein